MAYDKKNFTYSTAIHPSINYDLGEFTQKVDSVLADPRGWAQYGVSFTRVPKNADITIELTPDSRVEKVCGFSGLSCCDMRKYPKSDIYLNYDNWMGKSKSELPLDDYRNYVINHEVGHALGLDHAKCPGPGRQASIMQQMSKGPDWVAPCKESAWPNPPAIYNEFVNVGPRVGGGDLSNFSLGPIITAIILILLIIFVAFAIFRPSKLLNGQSAL